MRAQEKLIVAADFNPRQYGAIAGVRDKVLELGKILVDLGVTIKVNSILRACGYSLIEELHVLGLRVCADLKLTETPNTMAIDGAMLAEMKPELLTVMCSAGVKGIRRIQSMVGDETEILGVTVFSSVDERGHRDISSSSIELDVLRFAHVAQGASLKGLVVSPQEIEILKGNKGLNLGFNAVGIRPEWSLVPDDDQERTMTHTEAVGVGADRMIVGRPITQSRDPRGVTERILREVEEILT